MEQSDLERDIRINFARINKKAQENRKAEYRAEFWIKVFILCLLGLCITVLILWA